MVVARGLEGGGKFEGLKETENFLFKLPSHSPFSAMAMAMAGLLNSQCSLELTDKQSDISTI